MMLGFLLARAGVSVAVLEKHADFLRDFRGDTVHPSTLEVMHELGLLEQFLKRPHQKARVLTGYVGGVPVPISPTCRRAPNSSRLCRSGTSSTSWTTTPDSIRPSISACRPRS